ncbi:PIR protein [Plasmodium vivax]|uniref:VIR protein n=1 Tax=Plasmodium vivax TaxID=5855 RepID=A0A565A4Y0_PLAVI|nr:PIR protein [Plasmodium vivax]
MTKEKKTYTHADFVKNNEDLNISNINKLYVAFFDDDCYGSVARYLHCSSDNSYESILPSLFDLYKKFERNITSISNESIDAYKNIEKNKSKLCIYLKYWLYDQLIKRKVNQENYTKFFNLWNERKAVKCSECECEFPIKEFSEIEQIKKIYDFFLFWDSYKDKEEIINVISNKEYCKYIDASKSLYYLYQMKCEKDNNLLLCKEFNKYIFPHLKIDDNFNIICKKEVSDPDDWPVFSPYFSNYNADDDLDRSLLQGRREEKDGRVDLEEGVRNTGRDSPPPPTVPPLLTSTSPEVTLDQDLQTGHDQNAEGDTDLLVPDSSNDGKSTGTIISTSSVGTVGFLFLLYKFTPLRSMLDPRIRKTRNNLMNGVQGSNELQSQDYDFYPQDAPFNRYNIGYQSS